MNTRSKGFLILLAILLLAIPTIATLVTPTTYHRGALIYAEFWDFHGEVGARNGSMENVSIENATNVNSSNLNISSKFYVNTSGAIYQGTYNGSPILQGYLDARLLKDSNSSILLDTNKTILTDRNASILVKQMVDSCTAANDALGWNGTGFDCRTVSAAAAAQNNLSNISYYTTNQTLDVEYTILVFANVSDIRLVLPETKGRMYVIKRIDGNHSNNVTLTPTSRSNLTFLNLTLQNESVIIQHDGSAWNTVSYDNSKQVEQNKYNSYSLIMNWNMTDPNARLTTPIVNQLNYTNAAVADGPTNIVMETSPLGIFRVNFEWELDATTGGNNRGVGFGVTNTPHVSYDDSTSSSSVSFHTNGVTGLIIADKYIAGVETSGTSTSTGIVSGTKYYASMQNDKGNYTLTLYSNTNRTTKVLGTPIWINACCGTYKYFYFGSHASNTGTITESGSYTNIRRIY